MINKNIWCINGLEEAMQSNKEDQWLINYFKEHSHKIIYEACEWLMTNEDDNYYFSLCLNGDENNNISFIVQQCGDDKHWFYVKKDYSDIKEVFHQALYKFIEEVIALPI